MIIGIDPDLDKSGVALVENNMIMELRALTFFDLIEFITENRAAEFVIEDVEYNKPVFDRGLTQKANLKVAQNVGQVKGVARKIIEWLERSGVEYKKVPPLTGGVKMFAKKDAKYFNRITGWVGSSNEDKRDAALLALFGV